MKGRSSPRRRIVVTVNDATIDDAAGNEATDAGLGVHAVSAELLSYGIRVFQAVVSGEMPVSHECDDADWTDLGIGALVREVSGLGLTGQQEVSLVFRVLAFADLVEDAGADARMAGHVMLDDDGVKVSERFLSAAAEARLQFSTEGAFHYDLDSLVAHLGQGAPSS